jgi:hypothetical protein
VDNSQRGAVVEHRRTVTTVCDNDPIAIRQESNALWLVEACDRLDDTQRTDVDHFDGVIAKRGDEEPFSADVGRQMVDASAYPGHANRAHGAQRVRTCLARLSHDESCDDSKRNAHGHVSDISLLRANCWDCEMPLTYQSGETIHQGDRVTYAGNAAVVELLVDGLSGDPEKDWLFENCGAGVMLVEPKVFGRVYLSDLEDDEDLLFVSQAG